MTIKELRKDAADNRQRLLVAGREVFAERGIEATLHDVARHAGVGVGTAYRRFANKEELMDAILVEQVDELEAILRDAIAEPDAWAGITGFLERSLDIHVRDRAVAQIMSGRRVNRERHDWQGERLAPLVTELTERAIRQGVLRDDLHPTDLVFVQLQLTAVALSVQAGAAAVDRPDATRLYRRYLWLALDGLRAEAQRSLLPVPALSTEDAHGILSQRTGANTPGLAE